MPRSVSSVTGRKRPPFALTQARHVGPTFPIYTRSGHTVDIAPASPMFHPWTETCDGCGGELELRPACARCGGYGRVVMVFVQGDPTRAGVLPMGDIPPGQLARLMALPDDLA